MYPLEQIDPQLDTSLALIKECVKRDHGVALCTPANLTIRNSVTNAICTVIDFQGYIKPLKKPNNNVG